MSMSHDEPVLLTKQYKDHTIPNAVDSLRYEDLPFNAYSVHSQPIRNLDVTIQVLDEATDTVLETVSGRCESGNIRVESSSLIRRTGSLEVQFDPDFFPSASSLVWFGRIFRVYVGIKDLSMIDHTVNFLLGTFYADKAGVSVDAATSSITIGLEDK
ncbi:flagellin, partial [Vagococcus elongatus]